MFRLHTSNTIPNNSLRPLLFDFMIFILSPLSAILTQIGTNVPLPKNISTSDDGLVSRTQKVKQTISDSAQEELGRICIRCDDNDNIHIGKTGALLCLLNNHWRLEGVWKKWAKK